VNLIDAATEARVPGFDLEAYCTRIGYNGPRQPTLPVLRDLHRLHPAAIPFEGLDVLLGREISLEAQALTAKLVNVRRGGYCFEQNSLLQLALEAIGFDVRPLIARSRWNRPLERPRARSHMLLRVRIRGEDWLADVGSRADMLAPIRFAERGPQEAGFEPLRLIPVGEELRLEMLISGEWSPVYDIVAQPQLSVDLFAANWFTSTHASSPFRQYLIAWHVTPVRRLLLAQNRLTVRPAQGEPTRIRLSADELERCLAEDFELDVEPVWRPALESAVIAGDEQEGRG